MRAATLTPKSPQPDIPHQIYFLFFIYLFICFLFPLRLLPIFPLPPTSGHPFWPFPGQEWPDPGQLAMIRPFWLGKGRIPAILAREWSDPRHGKGRIPAIMARKGLDPRPFWQGNDQIPASRLGSGWHSPSPSLSPFSFADRKR